MSDGSPALPLKADIRGEGGRSALKEKDEAIRSVATGGLWTDILERLKLSKQIVPVVCNPVFRELVAFKSADDDHIPLRLAARCGNSLPVLSENYIRTY
jgi:hypothetical protein